MALVSLTGTVLNASWSLDRSRYAVSSWLFDLRRVSKYASKIASLAGYSVSSGVMLRRVEYSWARRFSIVCLVFGLI